MPIKDPESRRRWQAQYNATHKAQRAAYMKGYCARHRAKLNARKRLDRIRLNALMEEDAELYAAHRAYRRIVDMRRRKPKHGIYRPCPSRRIPDYLRKGETVLDARSQWLAVNRSESASAWAKERIIENLEWRREHS